jgi:hypothetical protein
LKWNLPPPPTVPTVSELRRARNYYIFDNKHYRTEVCRVAELRREGDVFIHPSNECSLDSGTCITYFNCNFSRITTMNMYRIYFKINEDESNFVTKAETCQQAIGKWLMAMKKTLTIDENIIDLCQKILNDSQTNKKGDELKYDSDELRLHCIKTMVVDPDNRFYNISDAVIYTHQNLPERLKLVLSEEDIDYIFDLQYQYEEENGFVLEEGEKPDPEKDKELGLVWDSEIVCAYIQKKALEEGSIYAFDDLEEVYIAEFEYERTIGLVDLPEDDIIIKDDAIDLSKIKPN